MIRLRKYRIFLLVTVTCLFTVYLLSRAPQYSPDSWPSLKSLPRPFGPQPLSALQPGAADNGRPRHQDKPNEEKRPPLEDEASDANSPPPLHDPDKVAPVPPPGLNDDDDDALVPDPADDDEKEEDHAPQEPLNLASNFPFHWQRPAKEYFPVAAASFIPLPTGAPKAIPKIQHQFGSESAAEKEDRQNKLDKIRNAMKHSWEGYRTHAWMKDELSPASGNWRDKFNGWAATLVDSLDTLWIMGLKPEFEEAVKAVHNIDFTAGVASDIPLFETVIRYLGGLIGAYDVSGAQYPVLLEKAVQLAEVLMGAFDTPNRMPILTLPYTYPRTQFQVRAGTSVVLAEVGSLSLEFTRLAQLTKNSKYYDAVARISNELAAFQNDTAVPGLWPLHVDISGCDKRSDSEIAKARHRPQAPAKLKDFSTFGNNDDDNDAEDDADDGEEVVDEDEDEDMDPETLRLKDKSSFGEPPSAKLVKRQRGDHDIGVEMPPDEDEDGDEAGVDDSDDDYDEEDEGDAAENQKEDQAFIERSKCRPTGMQSPYGNQHYSIGGEGDSTYEYLAKEYLLLGGLEDQYRVMYETAVDSISQNLLYRAMIPDEKRKLLFAGKYWPKDPILPPESAPEGDLNPAVGHLACFIGGMVAMGSKVFNRPKELDVGSQLADGCVWGYESSLSGIMPDDISPVPCENQEECPWDQARWWKAIDPNGNDDMPKVGPRHLDTGAAGATKKRKSSGQRRRRDAEGLPETPDRTSDDPLEPNAVPGLRPSPHEQTVKNRIQHEGLWAGIYSVNSDSYILRPEAIESVWYMYRITGNNYWRQKGWKMFQAVTKGTRTKFGYSAVGNVAKGELYTTDEAESFWTAETLKYFYLLFCDPDTISLDDYVLNTEAHPFRRPKG